MNTGRLPSVLLYLPVDVFSSVAVAGVTADSWMPPVLMAVTSERSKVRAPEPPVRV